MVTSPEVLEQVKCGVDGAVVKSAVVMGVTYTLSC